MPLWRLRDPGTGIGITDMRGPGQQRHMQAGSVAVRHSPQVAGRNMHALLGHAELAPAPQAAAGTSRPCGFALLARHTSPRVAQVVHHGLYHVHAMRVKGGVGWLDWRIPVSTLR